MIYVGIDVAKRKHDCCILDGNGNVICQTFSFANSREGFDLLAWHMENALRQTGEKDIKAGLEATGHYGSALVAFLRSRGFQPLILNPLQVNLFRKAQTLRRTKTDKVDAKCIAQLLMSAESSPVQVSYQISELKSLTRQRSRLISQQAKLKQGISRLLDVLFPELASICSSPCQASIKALLLALPGAKDIARCRIDRLSKILVQSSRGRYGQEKAKQIKELAKISIGIESPAASLELRMILEQLNFLKGQRSELDKAIAAIVKESGTPLLSIPGIGTVIGGVILAEIGDINRFASADKLQAFAGLDPSTYQSGSFQASRTSMVKHGSTQLRWALMQAARLAAIHCKQFQAYFLGKRSAGKHYFVALGHLAKKLIRVIFRILRTGEAFVPQT